MHHRSLVALLAAGIGSLPSPLMAQPVDAPDATSPPPSREAPDSPAAEAEAPEDEATPPDEPEEAPAREGTPDGGETAPPGQEAAAPGAGEPTEPAPVPAGPLPSLPGEPRSPGGAAPGLGVLPSPMADTDALRGQGDQRPRKADVERPKDEVFAEDWWSHARPVFEIHGYFRLRAELFHNFSLGRREGSAAAIWRRPADEQYGTVNRAGQVSDVGPRLCTADETSASNSDNDDPADGLFPCKNKTQAGANIRFRLNPELHVSDNVRVVSQLDILDNVTLGSTPGGYGYQPADGGGYQVTTRNGFNTAGVFDDTIVPPSSGINSLEDSIRVKRVWGEYASPVGELRFGRMPNHWGLGMMHNAGDGYDDDFQSTIDRIQFITGLKPLDLYLGASWDFPNEGPISNGLDRIGGQSYDLAQLDDVNQWSLMIMRNKSPQLTNLALAKGNIVLNGGAYVLYRHQVLAHDQNLAPGATSGAEATTGANVPNATEDQIANGFSRRGASIWMPDLWFQLRYKKFRFEAEAAAILGSIESTDTTGQVTNFADTDTLARKLRKYGYALEIEQKLVEDRLRLDFRHGWSSSDPDAFDPDTAGDLIPGPGEIQVNDDTDSTFRFHPNYRVDLILHRYLLNRVQGTYYFRPDIEYDFMRKPSGQRFGGGAGFIWSRAGEPVQTPGHKRDLGIELNAKVYFQSKDGALNDDPNQMGGFYTMLQYGVLFPLQGMGYQDTQGAIDTSAAQIIRWYLGVLF